MGHHRKAVPLPSHVASLYQAITGTFHTKMGYVYADTLPSTGDSQLLPYISSWEKLSI